MRGLEKSVWMKVW